MSYLISNDTLNGKVDVDSLIIEIGASNIVPAIDVVTVNDDVLTINFKAALSGTEQTTLDGIVAAHEGISPEPEAPKIQLVSQTPLGIPLIAVKKPDGDSVTVVSHNFCDDTTWPAANDSLWSVAPPAGKFYKILKAEVQFTHDVQMQTLSPTPAEMNLDVTAGGNPVDQKVFKSILDVFDLGNAHYTMNATVDGIPGVTTVVFDYSDALTLKSSWAMTMDFHLKNHLKLGGTHCSVSLVVEPGDET